MFWLSVQQARQLGHVVPQFVGFEEDPLKVPLSSTPTNVILDFRVYPGWI